MHYHYLTLEQRNALEQSIRAKITDRPSLDSALARLHDGAYGVCFSCGRDIPYVELEKRPLALRCGRCNT